MAEMRKLRKGLARSLGPSRAVKPVGECGRVPAAEFGGVRHRFAGLLNRANCSIKLGYYNGNVVFGQSTAKERHPYETKRFYPH